MANFTIKAAPSLASLRAFRTNKPGALEANGASLYDSATYLAAGHTQLNFFQNPVGSSGKTFEDTNMELSGALAQPKSFVIQGIELHVFSSLNHATLGAPAAQEQINDVIDLGKTGWLDLFIGTKSYLIDAPLVKFPPTSGVKVDAAMSDATTAGAALNNRIAIAQFGGKPYEVSPPIVIDPQQNFKLSLNWGTVVPVSANMRIVVSLKGIMYRQA